METIGLVILILLGWLVFLNLGEVGDLRRLQREMRRHSPDRARNGNPRNGTKSDR